jgi:hypothetical protein
MMFEAINWMLREMLAAVARKGYDDRRHRQAQGQAKVKADTRGVQKTPAATKVSPACWPPVSRGVQSRTSRAAAAQQSRRSPTRPPSRLSAAKRILRQRAGLSSPAS